MKIAFGPTLSMLIFLTGTLTAAAEGGLRCASIHLDPRVVLVDGIALPYQSKLPEIEMEWRRDPREPEHETIRAFEAGTRKHIGEFDFVYDRQEKVLDAENMFVSTAAQGLGIGRLFFQAVHERYPAIQEIRASLTSDNFKAFFASAKQGYAIRAAVKSTAFYKQNEDYGFKRVELRDTDNLQILNLHEGVDVSIHREVR